MMPTSADEATAEAVLAFWFGSEPYDSGVLAARMHLWFEGGSATDAQVRRTLGDAIVRARAGAYDHFRDTARGALALILLLDQAPRHVYRGQAAAFSSDDAARRVCLEGLEAGRDRDLTPVERQFFYLPLQHSEDPTDQARCVALFAALLDEIPEGSWLRPALKHALDVAHQHERIIARYGRYPHRNQVLGRRSSLAEHMYLDAGGTDFGQATSSTSARGREGRLDARPIFRIARGILSPEETVCVDGTVQGLRCVSHWPGAVVPKELQHDLSTGMALSYARMSASERARVLGHFSIVTNDHYDTDGVLSAFSLIAPRESLAHADLMLRAAAAGDLRTYQGEDALSLDLTVWALAASPRSPLAARLARDGDYLARAERCYAWLLANLPDILRDPLAGRALFRARLDQIMADLRAVDARDGVHVEHLSRCDLAVVTSRRPLTRHGLVHAAGEHYRVLHVVPQTDGFCYRFLYRNESWFLGMRDRVPERIPLAPLRDRLTDLETARAGGWWSTPLEQTSAQLGFGHEVPVTDVFGDLRPDLDPPSALAPDRVVETLLSMLARPTMASPASPSATSELP